MSAKEEDNRRKLENRTKAAFGANHRRSILALCWPVRRFPVRLETIALTVANQSFSRDQMKTISSESPLNSVVTTLVSKFVQQTVRQKIREQFKIRGRMGQD